MKVLVSGSTGLVGQDLMAMLSANGYQPIRLARQPKDNDIFPSILWDPVISSLNTTHCEGIDAVVHLAGENIAAGYWTAHQKEKIRDSRIQGTRFLCERLAKLKNPPKVLVCASATGFYGDRGSDVLDEASAKGTGFLSDVCAEWEAATQPAKEAGIRVLHLRFGMVLSPKGGALAKVLPLFQLGGGGNLGNGKQIWSWIALDDVLGAIHHALVTDSLSGAVNVTAPETVSNAVFTKTLATVLRRPALFPAPALALTLLLGEFAEALLLASVDARPKQLEQTGYAFRFPELEPALRYLLGK